MNNFCNQVTFIYAGYIQPLRNNTYYARTNLSGR